MRNKTSGARKGSLLRVGLELRFRLAAILVVALVLGERRLFRRGRDRVRPAPAALLFVEPLAPVAAGRAAAPRLVLLVHDVRRPAVAAGAARSALVRHVRGAHAAALLAGLLHLVAVAAELAALAARLRGLQVAAGSLVRHLNSPCRCPRRA